MDMFEERVRTEDGAPAQLDKRTLRALKWHRPIPEDVILEDANVSDSGRDTERETATEVETANDEDHGGSVLLNQESTTVHLNVHPPPPIAKQPVCTLENTFLYI
jgi:hypothetical protein